jgi:hypothetical protein
VIAIYRKPLVTTYHELSAGACTLGAAADLTT